jgi:hypothetical protein
MKTPPPDNSPNEPTHAEKFDALLGVVLSIPKTEIEKRDAEWRKQKKQKSNYGNPA